SPVPVVLEYVHACKNQSHQRDRSRFSKTIRKPRKQQTSINKLLGKRRGDRRNNSHRNPDRQSLVKHLFKRPALLFRNELREKVANNLKRKDKETPQPQPIQRSPVCPIPSDSRSKRDPAHPRSHSPANNYYRNVSRKRRTHQQHGRTPRLKKLLDRLVCQRSPHRSKRHPTQNDQQRNQQRQRNADEPH